MRIARLALVSVAVAVGVTALAHVPLLLGPHHGAGTCPFGYGTSRAPAGPLHHNAALRGVAAARARPALGLALQAATREGVTRWAAAGGGTCAEQRGALECDGVHLPGAPEVSSAWFAFDGRGTLDAVRTVRRAADPATISRAFDRTVARLTAEAGAPYRTHAAPTTAVALAAGALSQASAEYRFTNYRALVRATNLGADGYVLTEEYANLADSPAAGAAGSPGGSVK